MRWTFLILLAGCSCSRPPGPVPPDPPAADAGTDPEASASADAASAPDGGAVETSRDADVEPEIAELPPELTGTDESPIRILFEEGKAEIQEIAEPMLGIVVERLRLRPEEIVRLVGHCDAIESRGRSMELSSDRAQAVRRFLQERGVAEERFLVDARGNFQPAGDDSTPEGRRMNRRVDVQFERAFGR